MIHLKELVTFVFKKQLSEFPTTTKKKKESKFTLYLFFQIQFFFFFFFLSKKNPENFFFFFTKKKKITIIHTRLVRNHCGGTFINNLVRITIIFIIKLINK
jgi:hypothetical protein